MPSPELLDAVPYWTEKMYPPGGGQDHLGLGSVVTDGVLPRLSPGINVLTPSSASRAFSSLAALHPSIEYIRLEDRSHDVIAFADFRNDDFLYVDRATDDSKVLDPPATEVPPWRTALESLYDMAGAETAAT